MGAMHCKASSDLVWTEHCILECPLDIGKAASHHAYDLHVTGWTHQWLDAAGNEKCCAWRYEAVGLAFVSSVDEVNKRVQEPSVSVGHSRRLGDG